ncbi:MAG: hypothetical protein L0221_08095 [Chloroflexi bacterium]|nr:hypothetical protein [Chloroflexota bacterium]
MPNRKVIDVRRVALLTATGALLVLFAIEFVEVWRLFASRGQIGWDWSFYASLGRRWLETGVMYGDRQLTGQPYHVEINVDNLYPPPATVWFVPFAVLPAPISAALWWGLPTGAVVAALVRFRPALWAWPLMALCLAWPRSVGPFVVGNSDLWSAGFVAGGLLWGWPGALGILKPSLAPFAFVGARGANARWWWLAVVVLGAISLALFSYWPQYLTAATHWDVPLDRALASVPLLLLPIVAWSARTDAPRTWLSALERLRA